MSAPTGLRIAQLYQRPGGAKYVWDVPPDIDPMMPYVLRRDGVPVRRSFAYQINGNDSVLYWPETHQVTVEIEGGEVSAPLTVSLPGPPTAVAGGEVLYLNMSFADTPYNGLDPITSQADFINGCAWIERMSGGRMKWIPTRQDFALTGNKADYAPAQWGGTIVDIEKVKAEVTAALDLKSRAGLWRVILDFTNTGFAYNSGSPMWPGADIPDTPTYGQGVWAMPCNSNNFCHEIFHTLGLWHCGAMKIPDNVEDLTGRLISYASSETMGVGAPVNSLTMLNMWMLGVRDPAAFVYAPAWGGNFTINRSEVPGGVQAIIVPLTASGAAYVFEYRAPYLEAWFRPVIGAQGFSMMQVGFGIGAGQPLLRDPYRNISVDIVAQSSSSATVRITTPIPAPAPIPPIPAPTPIPTPPSGGTIRLPKRRGKP